MQAHRVAQHDLQRVVGRLAEVAASNQLLDRRTNQGQWRAQLVRNVGEELVLQAVELTQTLQRLLELEAGLIERRAGLPSRFARL